MSPASVSITYGSAYSLRSKTALKTPQARSESGACGSSRWTATRAARWSIGTTADPDGNGSRSRAGAQVPGEAPDRNPPSPGWNSTWRPSKGRPCQIGPSQR